MRAEDLLKRTEGKTLEFKQDLSAPKNILKSVIAFANTAGGTVVIGRADDGTVVGLGDVLDAEERLANLIADSIAPGMMPEIEAVTVADKALDKPMRNHTLMGTIARINRVFFGKVCGLIVDYVGVFRNLEKALAISGSKAGSGTDTSGDKKPVEDKSAFVAALRRALAETERMCRGYGVHLDVIRAADGLSCVSLLDDAVDALVGTEDVKRGYLDLANVVHRLYKAVLPDPEARECLNAQRFDPCFSQIS